MLKSILFYENYNFWWLHLFLTIIPNHLKAERVAVWVVMRNYSRVYEGVGKGREKAWEGALPPLLSLLCSVILRTDSVGCGAHSRGRERRRAKGADAPVLSLLQMKLSIMAGVWYGVEGMSRQVWNSVCVCVGGMVVPPDTLQQKSWGQTASPWGKPALIRDGAWVSAQLWLGSCLGQWPQERALDPLYVVHGLRGNRELPGWMWRSREDSWVRIGSCWVGSSGFGGVQWSAVAGVIHARGPGEATPGTLWQSPAEEDTTQTSHPCPPCHEDFHAPRTLIHLENELKKVKNSPAREPNFN